jgi:hypothetical protein
VDVCVVSSIVHSSSRGLCIADVHAESLPDC